MESDEPAPDQSAQSSRPKRIWDAVTRTWIEAAVRRRNPLGQFDRLTGQEPGAQLVFDFLKGAA